MIVEHGRAAPAGGDATTASGPAYRAGALERGLRALEGFTPARPLQSLSEIAEGLGLTRSAAYRVVMTLEQLGYIARSGDGKRYRLTPRVLALGHHYLKSLDFHELAAPHLDELRDTTGLTAHLGVRDGTEVVYVYRALSRRSLVSNVPVGTRLPAHATSMGRVLLTGVGLDELAVLYGGRHLEAYSAETPTSLVALQRRIEADRARGYVISHSSFAPGTAAIAAPLQDQSGRVLAAINLSGPESLVDDSDLEQRLVRRVLETAKLIGGYL